MLPCHAIAIFSLMMFITLPLLITRAIFRQFAITSVAYDADAASRCVTYALLRC